MARLRRFVGYRRLKRPWTRTSKYKKLSYVKTVPHRILVNYNMGNPKKAYSHKVILLAKRNLQIRDNALESARQTSNKLMEKTVGTANYFMKILKYPHQILREHAMATGAGADRFSSGMARPFGKPIANAARIFGGDAMIQLSVDKANLEIAQKALRRAATKLPCSCMVEVMENRA